MRYVRNRLEPCRDKTALWISLALVLLGMDATASSTQVLATPETATDQPVTSSRKLTRYPSTQPDGESGAFKSSTHTTEAEDATDPLSETTDVRLEEQGATAEASAREPDEDSAESDQNDDSEPTRSLISSTLSPLQPSIAGASQNESTGSLSGSITSGSGASPSQASSPSPLTGRITGQTGTVTTSHEAAPRRLTQRLETSQIISAQPGDSSPPSQSEPPGSTDAEPVIALTPSTMTFTATENGTNPGHQTVELTNVGGGTLSWTVSSGASWLTASPVSGTTGSDTDRLTVMVDISNLNPSTYTAALTVTSSSATNSPQTLPITLTVAARALPSASLTWDPNSEPDLAGYKVYQSTQSGGPYTLIQTIDGNTPTYKVQALDWNTTYHWVVTAFDTSGNESGYSNEASLSVY